MDESLGETTEIIIQDISKDIIDIEASKNSKDKCEQIVEKKFLSFLEIPNFHSLIRRTRGYKPVSTFNCHTYYS